MTSGEDELSVTNVIPTELDALGALEHTFLTSQIIKDTDSLIDFWSQPFVFEITPPINAIQKLVETTIDYFTCNRAVGIYYSLLLIAMTKKANNDIFTIFCICSHLNVMVYCTLYVYKYLSPIRDLCLNEKKLSYFHHLLIQTQSHIVDSFCEDSTSVRETSRVSSDQAVFIKSQHFKIILHLVIRMFPHRTFTITTSS